MHLKCNFINLIGHSSQNKCKLSLNGSFSEIYGHKYSMIIVDGSLSKGRIFNRKFFKLIHLKSNVSKSISTSKFPFIYITNNVINKNSLL